jgi:hypothetical protein
LFVGGESGMPPVSEPELSHKEKVLAKLGVLAVLTATLVPAATKAVFREPYPALLLPAFKAAPETGRYMKADIGPVFDDETAARITIDELFAELPPSHRWVVLDRMFGPVRVPVRRSVLERRLAFVKPWKQATQHQLQRETATWLSNRLDRLFPGKRVSRVEFLWRTYDCNLIARPPVRVVTSEKITVVNLEENEPRAGAVAIR